MIKGFCGHITINLIQTFITLFPKLLPVNFTETSVSDPSPLQSQSCYILDQL